MSSILYYSNFCDSCKRLLQTLSKTTVSKDIHFINIDKRVKGQDGKLYIVLANGQQIVMPENITRVPALLLLNKNYQVVYGDSILNYMKPMQEEQTRIATQNNLEPMAFSLGGGGGFGIMSDNYSFLDMDSDALSAKGDGGMRQMHNYVDLNANVRIHAPEDDVDLKKQTKIPETLTLEQLQNQRDQEFNKYAGGQQRK